MAYIVPNLTFRQKWETRNRFPTQKTRVEVNEIKAYASKLRPYGMVRIHLLIQTFAHVFITNNISSISIFTRFS